MFGVFRAAACDETLKEVLFQVVQGGVIGRLTARYPEKLLLLMSIGVSAGVGLAQVHKTPRIQNFTLCVFKMNVLVFVWE